MFWLWRTLLILAVSFLAFAIEASIPFAILVLLVYFEFIYKKKEEAK